MQQVLHFLIFIVFPFVWADSAYGQNIELVGIELARFPKDMKIGNASDAGTRIQFFVKDTVVVTGLTKSFKLEQWTTNTGRNLDYEHSKLVTTAVLKDNRMARDTALLSQRGFWSEHGKGFVFKLHSWALPDSAAISMSIKAEVEYTTLTPEKVLLEDITHLAGNIEGLTGLEFMGNSIDLRPKLYGQGTEAYMTFNGTLTNKTYQVAIKTMQFLDKEGKIMDELYFGLNNNYSTSTRNRVDLRKAVVLRMHYRKLKVKKIKIDSTFGLGF
ncbi:hypothetical protein [Flagellimonas flava]|uniref:Uncharacterized protein n=1 Tax=Flagellimonas flava TaxID=570519 RepID=A0A1M5MC92_9FLAO|nr:hypothetical protein [Allomuricauda flava]SHG74841.1 hypothetical protein SAMN04488116_2373 [Allomuricauda flava]